MSPGSGIELSLLNNDPTSTLLMTPEGQPLYSIVTPVAEHDPKRESSSSDKAPSSNSDISAIPNKPTDSVHPVQRSHSYRRKALKSRTTINRLDHLHASSGHVETTVGIITYPRSTSPGVDSDSHDQPEVTLDLCEQKCVLTIEAVPFTSHINRGACVEGPRKKQASVKEGVGRHQGDGGHESSDDEWVLVAEMKNASKTKTLKQQSSVETSSWEFVGPDNKSYKWQLLVHYPVLTVIDKTTVVPLARYRRAKLGIISRPRKGFLEILPVGCPIMDLIVSTFVTFMKHWVLPLDIIEETSESIVSLISNCNVQSSSEKNEEEGHDAPQHSPPSPSRSRSFSPSSSPPLSSRFRTAAYLARKHSASPLTRSPSFPPYSRPKSASLEPPSIIELNQ